jgi:predicted nucleotidyltransferase
MTCLFDELYDKGIIKRGEFPPFLRNNIHYLTVMGSNAYGIAQEDSDFDLYGWCIEPKEIMFPHLKGEIPGFGKQTEKFKVWQKHHVVDPNARGGKSQEYDFNIYSIVSYLNLCMDCNPNMIDSLFTPRTCVLYSSPIGEIVRQNRKMFLHKGAYWRFKGYSFSQIHKMRSMNREGKRKEGVEKYGYDLKFFCHCIRLLNECEQILTEGDIDLQRGNDELKAIRRGEYTLEQALEMFNLREKTLEAAYAKSTLPHHPDEAAIKNILIQCLEIAYGDTTKMVVIENKAELFMNDVKKLLEKYT